MPKITPFYFRNNFVNPRCILVVFGTHLAKNCATKGQ